MSYSNLTFKQVPFNEEKNFIFDDISIVGSVIASLSRIKFMYQRLEHNKIIKVSASQFLAECSNLAGYLNKPNYVIIENYEDNGVISSTSYYFVDKIKQVAEQTIQCDLTLDVLNTFKLKASVNLNDNSSYSLSDKTLVNREHKDRMGYISAPNKMLIKSQTDLQADDLVAGNFIMLKNGSVLESDPSVTLGYRGHTYIVDDHGNIVYDYYLAGIQRKIKYYRSDNITMGVQILQTGDVVYKTQEFPDTWSLIFELDSYMIADIPSYISEFYLIEYINSGLVRNIDVFSENISTTLFKVDEETLYDDQGLNTWYVIFESSLAVVSDAADTSSKYVNPVIISFVSDEDYTLTTASASARVIRPQDVPDAKNYNEVLGFAYYYADGLSNYVEINGVQYKLVPTSSTPGANEYHTILVMKQTRNSLVFEKIRGTAEGSSPVTIATNVDSIIVYGFNTCVLQKAYNNDFETTENWKTFYIGSGINSDSGTVYSYENVDITDPKLIKAINYPYAPDEFLAGLKSDEDITTYPENFTFSSGNHRFELTNSAKASFVRDINFGNINPLGILEVASPSIGYGVSRNKKYESKLYHSDFYMVKFVYDSYSFSFVMENVDTTSWFRSSYPYEFIVNYVISSAPTSKMLFTFDIPLKRSISDYDNILVVARNNEKPLYNNAYLNYIRNGGLQYDSKNAQVKNNMNALTTALSIVGAVGSFASSAVTGGVGIVGGIALASTAISGIARTITTAQEQDRAIAQKMTELINQGASVSIGDDMDVFKAYSGNKAKLVEYKLSSIMEDALWDLFHYFGYATHEYKVPNVNTRIYFNYLQADIVIKNYYFNKEFMDDIIRKYKEGVTFMHKVNSSYDYQQEYENFESSIM